MVSGAQGKHAENAQQESSLGKTHPKNMAEINETLTSANSDQANPL